MYEKERAKADVLIEAIPYIRKFAGTTVVVKYGGSAMVDEKLKKSVIKDIALLKYIGLKPVVVHGGGKEITALLDRLGKETQFVDGLRVTDAETAGVAEMVLSGSIGKSLVENLESVGVEACGINGKDGHTLQARKKVDEKGRDLGFVGEIEKVDIHLIETLLEAGYVPVISPVGVDSYSQTYNINADYAASAIAGALNAQKLVFLTDVEGILRDKDDPSTIIRRMSAQEAIDMIADGTINGGMIPKVECCLDALRKGVRTVHVLDGRLPHSMLLEIFTADGSKNYMKNYAQFPIVIKSGKGMYVTDEDGKSYLDFVAGIAVNALGYGDENEKKALLSVMADGVFHTSNLYYNSHAVHAAAMLNELAGSDRVFFCNSGAEANEAALKIARKYGQEHDNLIRAFIPWKDVRCDNGDGAGEIPQRLCSDAPWGCIRPVQ